MREESAFERRAEQMLGSECVRERRAFLEWMERCAPEIEGDLAEKEEGDGDDNGGGGMLGPDSLCAWVVICLLGSK